MRVLRRGGVVITVCAVAGVIALKVLVKIVRTRVVTPAPVEVPSLP